MAGRLRVLGVDDAIGVQPIIVLTGASGIGKTTISAALLTSLPDVNVFDTDALLGLARFGAEVEWESWLNVAHAAAQGGRPTVLCGTVLPEWLDLDARDTVGPVHFGLLHCSDEERAARLRARPAWRRASDDDNIERHADFARHLLDRGWPVFDSTGRATSDTVAEIAAWVRGIVDGLTASTAEPDTSAVIPHADLARTFAGRLAADPTVLGVVIAGSVGRGEAVLASDVDLLVVVDESSTLRSGHEVSDGVLVEWFPKTEAEWQARFDQPKASWLYAFLDGAPVFDRGPVEWT